MLDWEGGDVTDAAVANLLPDGPAAKAGLRSGDAIVKWGVAAIMSVSDLLGKLSQNKPGDKVKLHRRVSMTIHGPGQADRRHCRAHVGSGPAVPDGPVGPLRSAPGPLPLPLPPF